VKRFSFHGPSHVLEVPGYFTLQRGESVDIDDQLAETLLAANPRLVLTVTDTKQRPRTRLGNATLDITAEPSGDAEPEAHSGEGLVGVEDD